MRRGGDQPNDSSERRISVDRAIRAHHPSHGQRDGGHDDRRQQGGREAASRRWRCCKGAGRRVDGYCRECLFDLNPRVADVLEPGADVFLQAAPEQLPNPRGQFWRQRGPVRVPRQNGGDGIRRRLTAEGRPTGDQLIQDAAEGPDIAACVDGQPASLLRTHVGRGADWLSLPASAPRASSVRRLRRNRSGRRFWRYQNRGL